MTKEGDAMRILVVEPERRPEAREIDGSLKSMQDVVGGWIQALFPFDEPVALICHDEGKLLNLPANRGLRDEKGQIYDIVCGTFFICGAPADCDHFTSLTMVGSMSMVLEWHCVKSWSLAICSSLGNTI